jgi:Zn-dependent peptidase ImmA (M78 family)
MAGRNSLNWSNAAHRLSPKSRHPAECARRLLQELNIQAIPIQPRNIAKQLEIVIWEREMESQYDGCLMRVGDVWGILINSLIQSQSRKRFTIAHELGHYHLDREETAKRLCHGGELGFFNTRGPEEQRANQFAVELLMPSPFFQEDAEKLPNVGLSAIDALSARYATSLTSTAIRYTRLSRHNCAIVFSENRHTKYFAYSNDFRRNGDCYLVKDKPLHPEALAWTLAESPLNEIRDKRGKVPLSCWCSTKSDQMIIEHSRCLPRMNQVVSFLWIPER